MALMADQAFADRPNDLTLIPLQANSYAQEGEGFYVPFDSIIGTSTCSSGNSIGLMEKGTAFRSWLAHTDCTSGVQDAYKIIPEADFVAFGEGSLEIDGSFVSGAPPGGKILNLNSLESSHYEDFDDIITGDSWVYSFWFSTRGVAVESSGTYEFAWRNNGPDNVLGVSHTGASPNLVISVGTTYSTSINVSSYDDSTFHKLEVLRSVTEDNLKVIIDGSVVFTQASPSLTLSSSPLLAFRSLGGTFYLDEMFFQKLPDSSDLQVSSMPVRRQAQLSNLPEHLLVGQNLSGLLLSYYDAGACTGAFNGGAPFNLTNTGDAQYSFPVLSMQGTIGFKDLNVSCADGLEKNFKLRVNSLPAITNGSFNSGPLGWEGEPQIYPSYSSDDPEGFGGSSGRFAWASKPYGIPGSPGPGGYGSEERGSVYSQGLEEGRLIIMDYRCDGVASLDPLYTNECKIAFSCDGSEHFLGDAHGTGLFSENYNQWFYDQQVPVPCTGDVNFVVSRMDNVRVLDEELTVSVSDQSAEIGDEITWRADITRNGSEPFTGADCSITFTSGPLAGETEPMSVVGSHYEFTDGPYNSDEFLQATASCEDSENQVTLEKEFPPVIYGLPANVLTAFCVENCTSREGSVIVDIIDQDEPAIIRVLNTFSSSKNLDFNIFKNTRDDQSLYWARSQDEGENYFLDEDVTRLLQPVKDADDGRPRHDANVLIPAGSNWLVQLYPDQPLYPVKDTRLTSTSEWSQLYGGESFSSHPECLGLGCTRITASSNNPFVLRYSKGDWVRRGMTFKATMFAEGTADINFKVKAINQAQNVETRTTTVKTITSTPTPIIYFTDSLSSEELEWLEIEINPAIPTIIYIDEPSVYQPKIMTGLTVTKPNGAGLSAFPFNINDDACMDANVGCISRVFVDEAQPISVNISAFDEVPRIARYEIEIDGSPGFDTLYLDVGTLTIGEGIPTTFKIPVPTGVIDLDDSHKAVGVQARVFYPDVNGDEFPDFLTGAVSTRNIWLRQYPFFKNDSSIQVQEVASKRAQYAHGFINSSIRIPNALSSISFMVCSGKVVSLTNQQAIDKNCPTAGQKQFLKHLYPGKDFNCDSQGNCSFTYDFRDEYVYPDQNSYSAFAFLNWKTTLVPTYGRTIFDINKGASTLGVEVFGDINTANVDNPACFQQFLPELTMDFCSAANFLDPASLLNPGEFMGCFLLNSAGQFYNNFIRTSIRTNVDCNFIMPPTAQFKVRGYYITEDRANVSRYLDSTFTIDNNTAQFFPQTTTYDSQTGINTIYWATPLFDDAGNPLTEGSHQLNVHVEDDSLQYRGSDQNLFIDVDNDATLNAPDLDIGKGSILMSQGEGNFTIHLFPDLKGQNIDSMDVCLYNKNSDFDLFKTDRENQIMCTRISGVFLQQLKEDHNLTAKLAAELARDAYNAQVDPGTFGGGVFGRSTLVFLSSCGFPVRDSLTPSERLSVTGGPSGGENLWTGFLFPNFACPIWDALGANQADFRTYSELLEAFTSQEDLQSNFVHLYIAASNFQPYYYNDYVDANVFQPNVVTPKSFIDHADTVLDLEKTKARLLIGGSEGSLMSQDSTNSLVFDGLTPACVENNRVFTDQVKLKITTYYNNFKNQAVWNIPITHKFIKQPIANQVNDDCKGGNCPLISPELVEDPCLSDADRGVTCDPSKGVCTDAVTIKGLIKGVGGCEADPDAKSFACTGLFGFFLGLFLNPAEWITKNWFFVLLFIVIIAVWGFMNAHRRR